MRRLSKIRTIKWTNCSRLITSQEEQVIEMKWEEVEIFFKIKITLKINSKYDELLYTTYL